MKKQQEIDRLLEENVRLKARLRYQERTATEGFFGSSTSSAKKPVKPNTAARPSPGARGGARPGHAGHGRRSVSAPEADQVVLVPGPESCPDCGGALQERETCRSRTVVDIQPLRRQTICYQLGQKYCPRCRRPVRPRAPGVFKRHLLGNRLVAHAAVQHFVFGVTLGHLEQQLAVGNGTLQGAFHRLSDCLEPACEQMVQDYRQAPVKHADETGWREDGRQGYAWLFCSAHVSVYRFRQTRAGHIAQEVLGQEPLGGVLVVDRYQGYNRAPCQVQYCYAHLLREVQDLQKEFPDEVEVMVFVSILAPMLAQAMQLRQSGLPPEAFAVQAGQIKERIVDWCDNVASHPGVQRLQNIFRENPKRLYHWADNPQVPAENNFAERELRPLVIARKLSFGSQSEKGARTREVLMSVLHTLRKRRGGDPTPHFTRALDLLAHDQALSPYQTLFKIDSS